MRATICLLVAIFGCATDPAGEDPYQDDAAAATGPDGKADGTTSRQLSCAIDGATSTTVTAAITSMTTAVTLAGDNYSVSYLGSSQLATITYGGSKITGHIAGKRKLTANLVDNWSGADALTVVCGVTGIASKLVLPAAPTTLVCSTHADLSEPHHYTFDAQHQAWGTGAMSTYAFAWVPKFRQLSLISEDSDSSDIGAGQGIATKDSPLHLEATNGTEAHCYVE